MVCNAVLTVCIRHFFSSGNCTQVTILIIKESILYLCVLLFMRFTFLFFP